MSGRIKALLEDTSLPVTLADPTRADVPLVFANTAFERLTGYCAEDVLGRNCRFLQAEFDQPGTRQEIREAIAGGWDLQTLLKNRKADGTVFDNLLFLYHLSTADGAPLVLGSQFALERPMAEGAAAARSGEFATMLRRIGAESGELRVDSKRIASEALASTVRTLFRTSH